jgi:hypothetical protein
MKRFFLREFQVVTTPITLEEKNFEYSIDFKKSRQRKISSRSCILGLSVEDDKVVLQGPSTSDKKEPSAGVTEGNEKSENLLEENWTLVDTVWIDLLL